MAAYDRAGCVCDTIGCNVGIDRHDVSAAVALVPAVLMPVDTGTFGGAFAWLAAVGVVGGAAFVLLARGIAPREYADARASLRNLSFSRRG